MESLISTNDTLPLSLPINSCADFESVKTLHGLESVCKDKRGSSDDIRGDALIQSYKSHLPPISTVTSSRVSKNVRQLSLLGNTNLATFVEVLPRFG